MLTRIALIFALILPFAAFTQEQKTEASKAAAPKPRVQYKLEFVITELENGKKTDSHEYVMLNDSDQRGQVRVSTRVPIATGSANPTTSQFTYMDVGVNIDATARPVSDAALSINTRVEISSIAMPAAGERSVAGQPIIRQFTGTLESTIPPGKPTTLLAMDEPNSKRSLQVQVTATLVR